MVEHVSHEVEGEVGRIKSERIPSVGEDPGVKGRQTVGAEQLDGVDQQGKGHAIGPIRECELAAALG